MSYCSLYSGIEYLVNCLFYKLHSLRERKRKKNIKAVAIRTLYKLMNKDFSPNTREEILVSFYRVWSWTKLKGYMFSVIRLEGDLNFFIGKFLQVLFFPSIAVVKTVNLEKVFLRSFFSNFVLPVIVDSGPVSFPISCRKWNLDEEISNYSKFIRNTFGLDILKIEIIRAKFSLVCRFKMMRCSRNSSISMRKVKLLLVKCRQGLSNWKKEASQRI